MSLRVSGVIGLSLWCASSFAQQPLPPIKSYKTAEEYCRDNPKMPTCRDGKPIDPMADMQRLYNRPLNLPSSQPNIWTTPRSQPKAQTAPTIQQMVPLQDWRFSHSAPAMLININIASLLESPIWKTLFPALGAESMGLKPEDLERARAALSDVGQILVSVAPGQPAPSVLMLVRGNLDGPLGAMLRSGAGVQAKRLDVATMLIGDPGSLEFANMRMRNTGAKTLNPLQQTASQEALKYDIWMGTDPRYMTSLAPALRANPALSQLGALHGVSMGLYLRDQIRVEGSVDAPSPDAAERMRAAFQAQARPQPGVQVWITAEGRKLRLIAILETSKLKEVLPLDAATTRMIGPQLAPLIQSLAGIGSASPSSPASSSSASAAPAIPGNRIVIQGLDDGPKALPAK